MRELIVEALVNSGMSVEDAEKQADIIEGERVRRLKNGLAKTTADRGRPRKDVDMDSVLERLSKGKTLKEICKADGVSYTTLLNRLREWKQVKKYGGAEEER